MNISVIGCGYVGLVTGACFAELGNRVILADNDIKKISRLKKGAIPIYEPGLEELVATNTRKKRLRFTSSIKEAVNSSKIIFIAVGTPSKDDGEADLTGIENVARSIAINLPAPLDSKHQGTADYHLIVEKSTVPVETGKWVKLTIQNYARRKVKFDVASNPEFLREGQGINDFMHPDRIVIGAESKRARDTLVSLYKPLNAPFLITDIKSAELIKHASNSYLATKISFINALSRICDKVGADVVEVAQGMGLDKRIGVSFLNAGVGFGGSCFPKDLDAFINISEKAGYSFDLLKAVKEINQQQKGFFLNKIKDTLWIIKDKTIGILGLSFKPNTDDIRNAPSIDIIRALQSEGAAIKVYDPQAMKKASVVLGEKTKSKHTSDRAIKFCRDPYEVCAASDCLLIITEWDEFKELDFLKVKKLLKRPVIIDGRNIYEPKAMEKLGFIYVGIGRKHG